MYLQAGLNQGDFSAWVAVEKQKIVAMGVGTPCIFCPPNDGCPCGKTAYIGNMYTLSAYRRQGIGQHLLMEEAKRDGCERIQLVTSDMGRPLYEKAGFAASGTAMAHYPLWHHPQIAQGAGCHRAVAVRFLTKSVPLPLPKRLIRPIYLSTTALSYPPYR